MATANVRYKNPDNTAALYAVTVTGEAAYVVDPVTNMLIIRVGKGNSLVIPVSSLISAELVSDAVPEKV